MKLTIRGKLLLAFGSLATLGTLSLLWNYRSLARVARALDTVTRVEGPTSAAAYEMEINAIGTVLAVLKYVETGDPLHLRRMADDVRDFEHYYAEYERLTQNDPHEVQLGRRVRVAFTEVMTLAHELCALRDRRAGLERDAFAAFIDLDRLVETRLLAPAVSRESDAVAHLARSIDASAGEVALSFQTAHLAGEGFERESEIASLRASLSSLAQRAQTAEERDSVRAMGRALDTGISASERQLVTADQLARKVERLVRLRENIDRMIDDELQVMTAADLETAVAAAERSAARARRAIQVLAVAFFAGSGLAAFGLLRVIREPLRGLSSGIQALERGELSHRIAVRGHDDLWAVVSAFNQMTAALAELTVTKTALEQRERHFRSLIDNAPDLILVLNGLSVRYASPATRHVIGEEPAALVDHELLTWIHEGDAAALTQTLAAVTAAGGPRRLVMRVRHADGNWRTLEAACSLLTGEPGVVLNARDITERVEAERSAVAAAVAWRSTLDAVGFAILVTDLDGRVQRLNRVAATAVERVHGDCVGRPVDSFADTEPWRSAAVLVESVRAGGWGGSTRAHDPASERTWDVGVHVALPAGEHEGCLVLTLEDVTERTRLEHALRRSERLSALGTLVAGVAHEVRNPLFSISANIDALQVLLGDRLEVAETVTVLRMELARLGTLMRDLMEYGSPTSGERSPGDVGVLLGWAVRNCAPLAERAHVALRVELHEPLPPVLMDENRLVRVFQNLIENAVQHSAAGSCVALEARPAQAGELTWVECRVRDRGPGFPGEVLPHVFEPFFSRRRGGTGLGLSIVKRIVEDHYGTIAAGNDGGAVVTVRLPAHGTAAGAGAAQ